MKAAFISIVASAGVAVAAASAAASAFAAASPFSPLAAPIWAPSNASAAARYVLFRSPNLAFGPGLVCAPATLAVTATASPNVGGSGTPQTTETTTNCIVAPSLFGELGYKASSGVYFGSSLAVAPEKMLAIEFDYAGFTSASAIPGVDIAIDCDRAQLEIDTLLFADYLYGYGGVAFPSVFLVPFLAILSNPPP
jgi:hypothetical protein